MSALGLVRRHRWLVATVAAVVLGVGGWWTVLGGLGYAACGNSLTPEVLGLQVAVAWTIGWVIVTFFVLIAYHLAGGGEGS